MTRLETNVFPITNLVELSSNYRLYRIRGLDPSQSEYHQNCQHIKRKLSYHLRDPVTVIQRDDSPHLVVREVAAEPPSPFPLVRTAVMFEPCPEILKLDYTVRSPDNDEICLRFLQFMIQAPLHRNPTLWQPGAGRPFFKKKATRLTSDLSLYEGFSVRAVLTPDAGLGLCVDVTSKTVSTPSLPHQIARDEFANWKGRHCIYHYGHQWYEIQVRALSDLSVSEYLIEQNGTWLSLLDYIVQESKKPIPPELAQTPHDASVILYQDNRGQERAVPTPLCYPVYGTDDEEASRQHRSTILPPHRRRSKILAFANQYLERLQFGDTYLSIASRPASAPRRMFVVPDLRFGGNRILSVRGTSGAQHTSLDELGRARLDLLQDRKAGFYDKDPLGRQYLILPQSVCASYGKRFLEDLRHTVDRFFPQKTGYDPTVVTYSDGVPRTFPHQGNAILKAVETECQKPGYAVTMIHHTTDRQLRKEDQLAALVVRELRERFDICSAIIHTTVGHECYQLVNNQQGEPIYVPRNSKRGKLSGYLRNVALNKVLLTNQRWPFILTTPLNADITIGIDVKGNTAGLVLVGKKGAKIRSLIKTSRQKEKLLEDQLQSYLVELLEEELQVYTESVRHIVIHRDGRTYPSETRGAYNAIKHLKARNMIASDASLTILEIPKTSPARFRLFEVFHRNGRPWIENPQVGYYYSVNEEEGYLCSTGRAFPRPGTTRPLHVRRVSGTLPLDKCLEDIYYLTALAWTRPEDCTRHPITIKLNDRFLGEEATEYDSDAVGLVNSLKEGDS